MSLPGPLGEFGLFRSWTSGYHFQLTTLTDSVCNPANTANYKRIWCYGFFWYDGKTVKFTFSQKSQSAEERSTHQRCEWKEELTESISHRLTRMIIITVQHLACIIKERGQFCSPTHPKKKRNVSDVRDWVGSPHHSVLLHVNLIPESQSLWYGISLTPGFNAYSSSITWHVAIFKRDQWKKTSP